jgi:hypothetical protein
MSLRRVPFGFTPTSITGCQLWLDGADPAGNRVIPASGTLSTWVDKSGVGNNAIAYTGATAPSFSSATNSITFGTNYYYISGISSGPSAQTLFMVLRRTTSSWNTPYGSSVNSGATWYMDNASPTFIAWNPFGQNNSSGANLLFYNNVTNVVCGTNNGGANIMYLNGTADTAGSTSFSSSGIMNIGTSSSGINGAPTQNGFIGTISEVIFYNSVLGTTQRQQVESYLAQKWGATSSLVAGHPGLTTTVFRPDYIKNSTIIRNTARPIPYFTTFSPRQIPGLVLWLDAADPAGNGVVPSSGTLTTWTDKSAAGNNAAGGVSPTYSSTTKAVSFNGSSTYLQTSLSAVPSNETFFAVFTSTVPISTPNKFNCIIGASGNNGRDINVFTSPAGNSSAYDLRYDSWAVGSISLTGYGGITFNTLTLATTQFTGGQGAGSTYSSNFGSFQSLSFSGSSTTRIGAGNGGDYFTGTINEIIMYNTVLGLSDRQKLESYLSQKWGLTALLPGAHSHFTQRAGAITTVANTKFRMIGIARAIIATGGTITTSGGFRIHSFTSVGTTNFVLTSPSSITAQVLVVAGGGAGGSDDGGGGGAGGVIYNAAFTITSGTYGVVVGNGGTSNGANGGNSVLSSLTAVGGGGGANSNGNGQNGGSGGGIGWAVNTPGSGTAGQGFAGGSGTSDPNFCAGGGGGAGGVGGTGSGITPGNGGIGVSHTIAGTTYNVGGGGGGGVAFQNTNGTNSTASFGGGNGAGRGSSAAVAGTPNTGGGGGGGNNMQANNGAFGGSGIVIIAYLI